MLVPQTLKDKNGDTLNVKVGESIDLSQVGFCVQEYENGELRPVEDASKYKFEICAYTDENGETWQEYDTEGWTLQEVPGKDLPILTRTKREATWFTVTVKKDSGEGNWYELLKCQYDFDALYLSDDWDNDSSEEMSDYELWVNYQDTIGSETILPNS